MKLLVLALITLASCTKERYEDAGSITDELLHELEKRLHSLQHDYKSAEVPQETTADFREIEDSIIKTSDSLDAGAIYLGSPESPSKQLCQNECLKNWTCNLAVFKQKNGETSCYLFNCKKPSVCSFVHHEGFITSELPERDTARKGASSEDDLKDLAAFKPDTTTVTTTSTTRKPTTTTTMTTTTAVQTQPPRQEPVPLFSECKSHKDCAGSYTQCLAGYCVCQENYHPQESLCRPDCTKFQFECSNEGQPLLYPQCIAIYDKCDGIEHCHDGSDEQNCAKETGLQAVQSTERNENKENSRKFGLDSSGFVDHKPVHPLDSDIKSSEENEKSAEKQYVGHWSISDNNKGVTKPGQPSEEDIHSTERPSTEDKSVETGKEERPLESGGSSSQEDNAGKNVEDNNRNNPETVATPSSTKKPVVQSHEERPGETIEVIEVENGSLVGVAVDENGLGDTGIAVVVQGNKGAVVALSLGLAITFLLLFFVGCRLRNVRKRLRRGRPMNSNEADYLINGMYL